MFYARLEPLDSQTRCGEFRRIKEYYDDDIFPRFEGMTLTLHEANPGHHLQDAVTKSLSDVPEFMKYPMFHR